MNDKQNIATSMHAHKFSLQHMQSFTGTKSLAHRYTANTHTSNNDQTDKHTFDVNNLTDFPTMSNYNLEATHNYNATATLNTGKTHANDTALDLSIETFRTGDSIMSNNNSDANTAANNTQRQAKVRSKYFMPTNTSQKCNQQLSTKDFITDKQPAKPNKTNKSQAKTVQTKLPFHKSTRTITETTTHETSSMNNSQNSTVNTTIQSQQPNNHYTKPCTNSIDQENTSQSLFTFSPEQQVSITRQPLNENNSDTETSLQTVEANIALSPIPKLQCRYKTTTNQHHILHSSPISKQTAQKPETAQQHRGLPSPEVQPHTDTQNILENLAQNTLNDSSDSMQSIFSFIDTQHRRLSDIGIIHNTNITLNNTTEKRSNVLYQFTEPTTAVDLNQILKSNRTPDTQEKYNDTTHSFTITKPEQGADNIDFLSPIHNSPAITDIQNNTVYTDIDSNTVYSFREPEPAVNMGQTSKTKKTTDATEMYNDTILSFMFTKPALIESDISTTSIMNETYVITGKHNNPVHNEQPFAKHTLTETPNTAKIDRSYPDKYMTTVHMQSLKQDLIWEFMFQLPDDTEKEQIEELVTLHTHMIKAEQALQNIDHHIQKDSTYFPSNIHLSFPIKYLKTKHLESTIELYKDIDKTVMRHHKDFLAREVTKTHSLINALEEHITKNYSQQIGLYIFSTAAQETLKTFGQLPKIRKPKYRTSTIKTSNGPHTTIKRKGEKYIARIATINNMKNNQQSYTNKFTHINRNHFEHNHQHAVRQTQLPSPINIQHQKTDSQHQHHPHQFIKTHPLPIRGQNAMHHTFCHVLRHATQQKTFVYTDMFQKRRRTLLPTPPHFRKLPSALASHKPHFLAKRQTQQLPKLHP